MKFLKITLCIFILTFVNISAHSEIDVDGLFIEAGADPRIEIPKKLGLELNSISNEVHVDIAQKTSIDGVNAAGDLTDGTDLKQTITAASQGAISALSAYQYVSEFNSLRQ